MTIGVLASVLLGLGAVFALGQRWYLNTDVTIALSYVGDDGRTYSCVYDFRTSDRLRMPSDIADEMNGRDWSQTGQLIYEWAKAHPADSGVTDDEPPADDSESARASASWGLALEHFIEFPPWTIDTGDGPEYELWMEARPGGTCENGLR